MATLITVRDFNGRDFTINMDHIVCVTTHYADKNALMVTLAGDVNVGWALRDREDPEKIIDSGSGAMLIQCDEETVKAFFETMRAAGEDV